MKFQFISLVVIVMFGSRVCYAGSDKDRQADILMVALPASAYLLTLYKEDEPGAWMLVRSLGLSAISTLALNSVIEKDSPNGSSDDAFPSGHTAIAFGAAGFIQKRYGWRSGIPAYVVASYVGWLREATDDHDSADVIGGAAVGILSSYLLTQSFNENVQASVWSDGRSAGLQIQVRW
jgi:membrane-associated phospholipid phosphatase